MGWLMCLWLFGANYVLSLRSIGEKSIARYEVKEKEEDLNWMLLPDGNGNPTVAILSGYEPDISSLDLIEYYLYRRNEDKVAEKVMWNNTCRPIFKTFDPKKKTKVLIHGFGDNAKESYMYEELREAYLERGDYNIIEVDWSALSAVPWYRTAAENTKRVGERVADFMDSLTKEKGSRVENIEIVGFSLGAHVAGAAGKQLSNVSRITGLDPAQVLFTNSPTEYRLDPSDARLVEVVHTSGGYLGFLEPLGHRDFFPNGGSWPQPGCELDYISVCSHRRAYYYFSEAVRSNGKGFKAYRCKSFKDYLSNCKISKEESVHLGSEHSVKRKISGKFFFNTNYAEPYGRQSKR